jgi:ATP-dependent Clp protease ATP-binding subunit ClpC
MKEIISFSRDEAERLGNDQIGTEHLLLGLLRNGDSTALRILKSFKVDVVEMQKEIERMGRSDKGRNNAMPLMPSAEEAIQGAVAEAVAVKSRRVEPEHLLLSILNNSTTASVIAEHIK